MNFDTFQGSVRPTLGVELEFQLVDARSMALTSAADRVLAAIPGRLRESVKPEFYESCVEVNTGVCPDVAALGDDLVPKLAATARAAARHGVLLGWGGTHPFSHWRDQPVVPTTRYRELAEHYRETLCRQVTFGLHVHVGVAHGDAAVRACNGVVEHLPALLALSANSPFWCGRATGLHSHRVEVMAVSPSGGLPPVLGAWDDYTQLVGRLTSAGLIGSLKDLWWDVRPSPTLGTVEIRMCDMPADLPSVLGLAALIQCLVVEAAGSGRTPVGDECGLAIIRQNRWRAARYGLNAEFVDPRTARRMSAREAVTRLVERLRGVAESLGCAAHLERARAMAHGPSGAERQLAAFDRTGDLREVVRRTMIDHSLGPAALGEALRNPAPLGAGGLAAAHGPWPAPASAPGPRGTLAAD